MPTTSNRRRKNINNRTSTSAKYNRSGWGKSYGHSTGASGQWTQTRKTTGTNTTNVARGYSNIYNAFEWKMRSYRTLWDQTRGPAKYSRPTPATLKTFANWINKGSYVWRVTNSQINKWCNTNRKYSSGTAVKSALCQTFGKNTIKAVACDKGGGYLVATSPTWKGKPFHFPK